MVEDEWQLFHERMDNPARFLKNEGKEALVFWQTKNVSTKVIELLIGFEATYSGAYPFTFRQPIKHKIAFKSTILYPFIP